MKFKKVFIVFIILPLVLAGCAGIGPNATYSMGATSFNYDPRYTSYMVTLNDSRIGSGFGSGTNVAPIKVGPQIVTWKDTNTGQLHKSKNKVIITKEQLKGKKYLAAHLYPDDTVEITTSNELPDPADKGLKWRTQLWEQKYNNQ
ncbi:hypothetical protein [Acinetobacter vivianii]|uniref:hypothetical protein n=1 Tax=Acinetobacter vivianii TaxID=1776742 RepID=UPI002DBB9CEA|nr:hypothetical protein [Acinetobacter vivianii]MEB6480697.1 hypothetical protein [Acinetobacter vivianii]MEB6658981.1 hypothetical protein [Acinetobacter vivianii]